MITLTQNVTDTFLLTFTKRVNISQIHSRPWRLVSFVWRNCNKKKKKTDVTHEQWLLRKSAEADNLCVPELRAADRLPSELAG